MPFRLIKISAGREIDKVFDSEYDLKQWLMNNELCRPCRDGVVLDGEDPLSTPCGCEFITEEILDKYENHNVDI